MTLFPLFTIMQQFNLNDFQRTPCVSSALNFQVNASECKKAISSVASIKHIGKVQKLLIIRGGTLTLTECL